MDVDGDVIHPGDSQQAIKQDADGLQVSPGAHRAIHEEELHLLT